MAAGSATDMSVPGEQAAVWIVEDEPAAATLAADLCQATGADAHIFRTSTAFLSALRDGQLPDAVVLDWRLERDLSAALFLAVRHHHAGLPVVYWTGSPPDALPGVIREDPQTRIVDKAGGASAFEDALIWALRRD